MRFFLAASCAAVMLVVNGWAGAAPKGDAQEGKVVYELNCLRCHGIALDGRGPDAPKLKRPPTNFHDKRSRKKGDAELEIEIKQGQLLTDMHPFTDKLSDNQIRDVIAYIRAKAPHTLD